MRSRGCSCVMVLERFFRVFFGGDEGISKALDGGGVLRSSNGGWFSAAAFFGRAADRLTIEAALILSIQEKPLLFFPSNEVRFKNVTREMC